MMVVCGDWDWGASDQPDIAMNRKTAPSIPANTFEPWMLRGQLIGMCFLDFFIMVIVDVELPRFLLVRPTWRHSAAKSRWRAQAPSQRSSPDTMRLLRCTNAKIRKGHRNFEGIFARWKIAGKTRESQTSVGQTSCLPVRAASCRMNNGAKMPRQPGGWKPTPRDPSMAWPASPDVSMKFPA